MDRWKFVNEKWIPRSVSRGEGFVRRYCFPTYACICSDNARKAVFSFRCLPHWGRGTAQRWIGRSRLETISFALFHTAFPIQPPPLRGTSFHMKEGVSTRAPSFGRGCRAQRGGVGFLFCGEATSSVPSPCRESCVILVPSSTTNISLTRASQRGAGSILRLFDRHAFSSGNPLHSLSNVLPHRRRGQGRPARGIPLCGYSL